ncbi:MAG: RND family transporter [Methanothrix sp.]|uniref:hydrophobe/amphiphile efflux-3 (HAE3) family transporter n=1 Tax=Methanothrix sp. TaxID=90426 RepID=UPI00247C2086|nr:RND family transporter [Methanothrix sp.]
MRPIDRKERLGCWIAKNPELILIAAVLLTLLSLHYAQQIEMHGMRTEDFVDKGSMLYQTYEHLFKERFATESITVVIEGDDVTAPEVLKAMDRLAVQMESVPDVISVTGISQIIKIAAEREIGRRYIPDEQSAIDTLLLKGDARMLQNILPDRRHTILSIEIPLTLTEGEREEVLRETERAVAMAEFPPGVGVIVTGNAALGVAIKNEMSKSNASLLGASGVLMILALLLVFRHVNWPLLPLPIVFLGIIWTFGIMGLLHIPMTMISMSAFPILIGIGIDYAIQFHNRIEEEFSKGGSIKKAVVETVAHTAPAVLIALAITAAGFFSLFTSTVPMIREFGVLCLIGLIMCYISALFVGITVLYAAERSGNNRKNRKRADASESTVGETTIGRAVRFIVRFSLRRGTLIILLALLLSLAGVYSDTLVPVDTDFKNYMPQDLPPLVQFRHLVDIFGGSDELNIIVQGDDITDPKMLEWMNEFGDYITESRQQVYYVNSVAGYMRMLNNGSIPEDATSTRYLLSIMPSSMKDRYIDGHDTAVMDINIGNALRDLGEEGVDRLIKEMYRDVEWFGVPPGTGVVITGNLVVMTTVIEALTTGRTEMTLFGLVVIFLMLLLIYRDLIKAIVPVLPMLVVIGWMGGVMYVTGMKYTPLTATLGALILGVGSEYSILMMERFYEELKRCNDIDQAMSKASSSIGSALVASGLTTVFGFGALITSPFVITNNFGTVTVLAVIFALITTFTVFPVLLVQLERERERIQRMNTIFDLLRKRCAGAV